MITETSQPITCFISAKTEILRDHAVPPERQPAPGRSGGLAPCLGE
jgi:hypothetical protein